MTATGGIVLVSTIVSVVDGRPKISVITLTFGAVSIRVYAGDVIAVIIMSTNEVRTEIEKHIVLDRQLV